MCVCVCVYVCGWVGVGVDGGEGCWWMGVWVGWCEYVKKIHIRTSLGIINHSFFLFYLFAFFLFLFFVIFFSFCFCFFPLCVCAPFRILVPFVIMLVYLLTFNK